MGLYSLLILALICTAISLVYYLRLIRLFWSASKGNQTRTIGSSMVFDIPNMSGNKPQVGVLGAKLSTAIYDPYYIAPSLSTRTHLTSACVVLLVVIPLFLIKPFVL